MPVILYAEDDAEHRLMMRLVMKGTNITLVEAVNGEDAIIKTRNQIPDLILLDLFMPKVDGFGVMEAVKADAKTCHIPIIVLSAWPTGDNRKRAREAGATEFLAKPYDPVELVTLVKKYLATPNTSTLVVKPKKDTAPLNLA